MLKSSCNIPAEISQLCVEQNVHLPYLAHNTSASASQSRIILVCAVWWWPFRKSVVASISAVILLNQWPLTQVFVFDFYLCLYWIALCWCQTITYELMPIYNLNLLAGGTSSPCCGNESFSSKPAWEGMDEVGWNCFSGWAFPTALLELLFQLCQALQKQKLGLHQKGFYGMDILGWKILALTLKRGLLLHPSFTWLSVSLDISFLNPTLLWMSSLLPDPWNVNVDVCFIFACGKWSTG